jgi:hypothetical protein
LPNALSKLLSLFLGSALLFSPILSLVSEKFLLPITGSALLLSALFSPVSSIFLNLISSTLNLMLCCWQIL